MKDCFDHIINLLLRPYIAAISARLQKSSHDTQLMFGSVLSELIGQKKINSIRDCEFKIFSQWGDDGIIQHLVNSLNINDKRFIEFGVENYTESNTRFLLINNNWSGLVMDGSESNVSYIKNDEVYWKYSLTAKAAFITAENINSLIREEGFSGEIGLLHIDVDGNDYWIWKAIDCVSPVIVILEYNSVFGAERAITVPYDPKFYRMDAHYSGLYAGASLPALCDLAEEKGYSFIGSNSAGNNAYFVRNDCGHLLQPELSPLSAKEGYVKSRFRECRDESGRLTYRSGHEEVSRLSGMKVVNTRTGKEESF